MQGLLSCSAPLALPVTAAHHLAALEPGLSGQATTLRCDCMLGCLVTRMITSMLCTELPLLFNTHHDSALQAELVSMCVYNQPTQLTNQLAPAIGSRP